jgi:hypothetical protein
MDNEIFLINEELRVPLLHIANKLLGRQNLNFNQLTPPEQQLWNLFKKVTFTNSLLVKQTLLRNSDTIGSPAVPN